MLLKNCKIFMAGKELIVDMLVADGKIAKVGHNLKMDRNSDEGLFSGRVIDVGEKYVLPGIIDPHVHFREPGLTHKEDFLSGSMAAAAGGVTTVLDMPNTIPPTTTMKLLDEKRELAKKSIVNYGFHFCAANDNIDEIKKAFASKGIASVKLFMNMTTGKLLIDDDKIMDEIFKSSKIVSVHAEGEKVPEAIGYAKKNNTRLYLCHISARDELDVIREEREDGSREHERKGDEGSMSKTMSKNISKTMSKRTIFAEATPHHLFLSEYDDVDSFTKMKPELKTAIDNEALIEAVNDGTIDTVGTDHAPHTVGEKLDKNFPHGIPGSETMLPLMLDAVNRGALSLQRVIELCCIMPARIFRIRNKGSISPGFDADLTVIDMDREKAVDEDELFTRCGWSPYKGRVLKGWPVMTIVNGNIVFYDLDGERMISKDIKGKEVEYDG